MRSARRASVQLAGCEARALQPANTPHQRHCRGRLRPRQRRN